MQTTTERVQQLRRHRDELKAKLAEVGDFRPGSLTERYLRCGKANCRCAAKGAAGHGPCWSLTRTRAGKTVTRVIPGRALVETRKQMAEYQRFRKLMHEWMEASAQLCDGLLAAPEAETAQWADKKKGSKRPLPRPSSRKLKRS